MIAYILGPMLDQVFKTVALSGEESADRFFKTDLVAGHRGHESVGGLLGLTHAVAPGVRAPGLVH